MTYGKVLLACMTGQLPLTATFTPILSEHLKTNEIEWKADLGVQGWDGEVETEGAQIVAWRTFPLRYLSHFNLLFWN